MVVYHCGILIDWCHVWQVQEERGCVLYIQNIHYQIGGAVQTSAILKIDTYL